MPARGVGRVGRSGRGRRPRAPASAVRLSRHPIAASNAWKGYDEAPATPVVHPVRVLDVTGDVTDAQALAAKSSSSQGTTLTYTAGGTAPSLILDYGQDVGGFPEFQIASGDGELQTCVLGDAPEHGQGRRHHRDTVRGRERDAHGLVHGARRRHGQGVDDLGRRAVRDGHADDAGVCDDPLRRDRLLGAARDAGADGWTLPLERRCC